QALVYGIPGTFPFRRGNPLNAIGEGWQVVQVIQLDDEEAALDRLEEAHQHEVHAFYLTRWKASPEEERFGALLEAFELHQQALHINLPVDPAFLSLDIYTQMRARKLSPSLLTGTLVNDPISSAAAQGKVAELYTFAQVEAGALNFKDSPYFRGIGLDFSYIHEQGGNMTQQLAFALGTLVEYLDWIEQSESALTIPEFLSRVAITFTVGTHFLLEIAKIRAFRLLYAKLVQAYGIEDEQLANPFILIKTDTFYQAKYDLYNNLLRTTTEAISGIIGGANAVIVQAFDEVNHPADARASRLARNIQHLLRHESYLDKVIDPAGGSYYIEQATDALGQHAWQLFQEMEAEGGFLNWVETGKVGELICTSAGQKADRVGHLKDKLIGVNQSPNTEEVSDQVIQMDGRLASAFEQIRSQGDHIGQQIGRRLQAQLLLFGDVKMRNARSQFARDLLGAGGLEIKEEIVDVNQMEEADLKGDI
ncbi:MAG: methylmalonyl-CoA mutase family protein, partial [Bacteroidota bacterium]